MPTVELHFSLRRETVELHFSLRRETVEILCIESVAVVGSITVRLLLVWKWQKWLNSTLYRRSKGTSSRTYTKSSGHVHQKFSASYKCSFARNYYWISFLLRNMSIPTDYNVLVVFLVPDPCLYDQYAISCTLNGPKRILNNNSFIFLVHNSIADFLVPVPWSQDQYSLKNVKRSHVHFVAFCTLNAATPNSIDFQKRVDLFILEFDCWFSGTSSRSFFFYFFFSVGFTWTWECFAMRMRKFYFSWIVLEYLIDSVSDVCSSKRLSHACTKSNF